jgi:hypothetical protein
VSTFAVDRFATYLVSRNAASDAGDHVVVQGDVRAGDADGYTAAYRDPWLAADPQREGRSFSMYQTRQGWVRLRRRFLLAMTMVTVSGIAIVCLLITLALFHGGWLGIALLVLLAVGAIGVAAAAGLVWIARRMWRRGAWLEALPLLAGQPWLSRVVWAARLMWTGHTLWRLRARVRPMPRY